MAASLDINMQQESCKFNWDDISVGNNQLDDSQDFFSKKHYEHERLNEIEILKPKIEVKSEPEEVSDQKDFFNSNKENIPQNISKEEQELKAKIEELTINVSSSDITKAKHEEKAQRVGDIYTENKDGQSLRKKVTPNLACEWSTKKIINKAAIVSKKSTYKTMPPPPQAYLVKDIYQRKREEAEHRRAEEERKKREFHPRPVPKFEIHHEQLQKRKPIHAVTVAVTPRVLKNSREAEEKRRKRLEELKLKNQPPKFVPRPLTVLKEKPFVPEKKPTVVQQCPFKLNVEKRLQERKQYDELKQKALEEKQKQVEIEEEERRRLEKERIKELRKAATFKARPNPFKN